MIPHEQCPPADPIGSAGGRDVFVLRKAGQSYVHGSSRGQRPNTMGLLSQVGFIILYQPNFLRRYLLLYF